jgi:hypothetical protein
MARAWCPRGRHCPTSSCASPSPFGPAWSCCGTPSLAELQTRRRSSRRQLESFLVRRAGRVIDGQQRGRQAHRDVRPQAVLVSTAPGASWGSRPAPATGLEAGFIGICDPTDRGARRPGQQVRPGVRAVKATRSSRRTQCARSAADRAAAVAPRRGRSRLCRRADSRARPGHARLRPPLAVAEYAAHHLVRPRCGRCPR